MNAINEFTSGPLVLDEIMKIVSLLENPPEAANVRKALRFYEMPDKHYSDYQWGANKELMQMLQHYACPQDNEELSMLLNPIKKLFLSVGNVKNASEGRILISVILSRINTINTNRSFTVYNSSQPS